MRKRTPEAARLEADYFQRVSRALSGSDATEVNEVIASLKEHIEEELAQDGTDDDVSLVRMANVLEELGPPEDYAERGEHTPAPEAPVPSKMSVKAILGALMIPIFVAVGILIGVIVYLASPDGEVAVIIGPFVFAGMIVGFVLSLAALLDIRRSKGQLRGRGFAIFGLVLPLVCLFLLLVAYIHWRMMAGPPPF